MPIISNFPTFYAFNNSAPVLEPCTNIETFATDTKVFIKWTDPDDLIVNGYTLATYGGTVLVRKQGGEPQNASDGTVVLTSTTRNAYKYDMYCDEGLTASTKYYYKLFPYTSDNNYTNNCECVVVSTNCLDYTLKDISHIGLEQISKISEMGIADKVFSVGQYLYIKDCVQYSNYYCSSDDEGYYSVHVDSTSSTVAKNEITDACVSIIGFLDTDYVDDDGNIARSKKICLSIIFMTNLCDNKYAPYDIILDALSTTICKVLEEKLVCAIPTIYNNTTSICRLINENELESIKTNLSSGIMTTGAYAYIGDNSNSNTPCTFLSIDGKDVSDKYYFRLKTSTTGYYDDYGDYVTKTNTHSQLSTKTISQSFAYTHKAPAYVFYI